jgi:hypothetical protein
MAVGHCSMCCPSVLEDSGNGYGAAKAAAWPATNALRVALGRRYDVDIRCATRLAPRKGTWKARAADFFRKEVETARFQFRNAREELIPLNQPVLGSSPRGLTNS